MSYLKDFQTRIANHDYAALLRLWEEYCAGDEIEGPELKEILKSIKNSEIALPFGRHVERILPLWEKMPDSEDAHEIFKLVIDLETTNNPQLGQFVYEYLHKKYSNQKYFNEHIRLIGLKNKESFQGAISNYELLSHMEKGNYVFHLGGWGAGEIVDVSIVREQLVVEFDYVSGKKELSFDNAFKSLLPIPKNHFLALRFGNPDLLEKQAKEDPVGVMRMLLKDLGPKTAAEIKDELCDLVIVSDEWTRWWQNARAKIKKDTMIETPETLREPFRLRSSEMPHENKLQKVLEENLETNALIQTIYSFTKDFPDALKNVKPALQTKLLGLLQTAEVTEAQALQLHFLLQDLSGQKNYPELQELIKKLDQVEPILKEVEILAFKKRVLVEVRKGRGDWQVIFASLLDSIDQNPIRDYLLSELLNAGSEDAVKKKLEEMLHSPAKHPEALVWYFQKIIPESKLPFADRHGKMRFFEAFLVCLGQVGSNVAYRDLVKKMHSILSADRYAVVRQLLQHATLEEVKEFLLLITKCHSFGDHDLKILHSLAEVVYPSLAKRKKKEEIGDEEVIWTTQEGYQKLQARIQQIATVETVENAKEIEVARSHGDLRENAEFKSALEKRDRLQGELKFLSDKMNKCRILTEEDVAADEVGVGAVVECTNTHGQKISYTLLGPWDAEPDKNILSFQSKLAQTMTGLNIGDKFRFQNEEFTITAIRNFLKEKETAKK